MRGSIACQVRGCCFDKTKYVWYLDPFFDSYAIVWLTNVIYILLITLYFRIDHFNLKLVGDCHLGGMHSYLMGPIFLLTESVALSEVL
jgi:hypothetical protein